MNSGGGSEGRHGGGCGGSAQHVTPSGGATPDPHHHSGRGGPCGGESATSSYRSSRGPLVRPAGMPVLQIAVFMNVDEGTFHETKEVSYASTRETKDHKQHD